MPPDDESDSDSEHLSAAPPISSPIRITPEPSDDHMTHLRHSAGEVKEDGEDTPIVPRLSVKERLYLSKKDIGTWVWSIIIQPRLAVFVINVMFFGLQIMSCFWTLLYSHKYVIDMYTIRDLFSSLSLFSPHCMCVCDNTVLS